jgi:hypothetical protein
VVTTSASRLDVHSKNPTRPVAYGRLYDDLISDSSTKQCGAQRGRERDALVIQERLERVHRAHPCARFINEQNLDPDAEPHAAIECRGVQVEDVSRVQEGIPSVGLREEVFELGDIAFVALVLDQERHEFAEAPVPDVGDTLGEEMCPATGEQRANGSLATLD